jgi:hypothetical protein
VLSIVLWRAVLGTRNRKAPLRTLRSYVNHLIAFNRHSLYASLVQGSLTRFFQNSSCVCVCVCVSVLCSCTPLSVPLCLCILQLSMRIYLESHLYDLLVGCHSLIDCKPKHRRRGYGTKTHLAAVAAPLVKSAKMNNPLGADQTLPMMSVAVSATAVMSVCHHATTAQTGALHTVWRKEMNLSEDVIPTADRLPMVQCRQGKIVDPARGLLRETLPRLFYQRPRLLTNAKGQLLCQVHADMISPCMYSCILWRCVCFRGDHCESSYLLGHPNSLAKDDQHRAAQHYLRNWTSSRTIVLSSPPT